jgi:hypothetical protein
MEMGKRRGGFQLMSQFSSSRLVRLGAVQLSGMVAGGNPYVGDLCDKERDSRVGADDESRASAVSKHPLRLKWRVWEIWAPSCLSKASTLHLLTSICRCKGAIFARASISAMPADVSLVKLM